MSAHERDPEALALMRRFAYSHLPTHLADISKPVCELAWQMYSILPDDPELTAGLRKLLEAKDCLVRVALAMRTDH